MDVRDSASQLTLHRLWWFAVVSADAVFGVELPQARLYFLDDAVGFEICGESQSIRIWTASAHATGSTAAALRYFVDELADWLPTTDLFWASRYHSAPGTRIPMPWKSPSSGDLMSLTCPAEHWVARQLAIDPSPV